MVRGRVLAAALVALCAAASPAGGTPKKAAKPVGNPPAAKRLDCTAHRFETTIELTGTDGKLHAKTVRMCGIEGETDGDWIATLEDAVKKTEASTQMPGGAKEQIVAAVRAEIARLSIPALHLPRGNDIGKLPGRSLTNSPEEPLSRDYHELPPLPVPSSVPPPHVLDTQSAPAEVAQLTLRCAAAGDADHPQSCLSVERDTILFLTADRPYPDGLSIDFLRHRHPRARIDLPPMNAGETATLRVPAAVCAGVVRSSVELDARSGTATSAVGSSRIGEYDLRC